MPDNLLGARVGNVQTPGNLASLHDLNSRFLDLLGDPAWMERRSHGAALKVAALPRALRVAVANCPYALFDLRFEDESFWLARLPATGAAQVADDPGPHPAAVTFACVALFYAWHIAGRGDRSAQLQLGMSERTVAAFEHTTVDLLPALAAREAHNLTPRWRNCHAYWSALAAAAGGDVQALRRVQLYGFQLAAAARLPDH